MNKINAQKILELNIGNKTLIHCGKALPQQKKKQQQLEKKKRI
jgi:hypothetical protein